MTRPDLLDHETVDAALSAAQSPWSREGDTLTLSHRFGSFLEAVGFVNEVARLAEAADHHPDIDVRYDAVRLVVSTHSAKGLTELDLALAESVSALLAPPVS